MNFGLPKGIIRLKDRILHREGGFTVERGSTPSAQSRHSGMRPSGGSDSTSPEGWHLSPNTPTLRVMNPDLPLPFAAGALPATGIHKPLPEIPKDLPPTPRGSEPQTPASIARSGSPEGDFDMRSVVYSLPMSPVDAPEAPRVLRVMNPDPEPQARPTNWSRPFGPDNPFPSPPPRPLAARPAPYRAGLDPHNPLYRGETSSVPLRPLVLRPAQSARPRPPLAPLVIPSPLPLLAPSARHSAAAPNFPHRNGVPTGRARFSVDSPIVPSPESPVPYARPANPTPYHPMNLLPQPTEPAPHAGRRSRGNSLATPPGLDTIREVNENPSRRKAVPTLGDIAETPLLPEARTTRLPKGMRWLDFRKWGSGRAV